MKVGEKLRLLRKQQGLTQIELARKAGIVQSSISDIETSNRVLNVSQLEKICTALDVPVSELLNNGVSSSVIAPPKAYSLLSAKHRRLVDDLIQELSQLSSATDQQGEGQRGKTSPVHVLGYAAAGMPLMEETFDDDSIELSERYADSSRFYLIRARGNSMEPKIHSGDVVVVQIDTEPLNGQIALVRLAGLADDEYTIKRFYREKDQIILRSYNKEYPDMIYNSEEVRSCEVVADIIRRENI